MPTYPLREYFELTIDYTWRGRNKRFGDQEEGNKSRLVTEIGDEIRSLVSFDTIVRKFVRVNVTGRVPSL